MRRNRLKFIGWVIPAMVLISCNGRFGAMIPDYSAYNALAPGGLEVTLEHDFSFEALDGFRGLIHDFNNTNEYGINIKLTSGQSEGKADLRFVASPVAASMLRRGESIELSPLVYHPVWGLENRRDDFYREARAQTDYWSFSRKITSIPVLMSAEVLLVNNGILQEYGFSKFPGSWPVMNFLLWKIKNEGLYSGMGMDFSADSVIAMINARGGSILRPGGFSYSFNNPVVNGTLRYIRERSEDLVISGNNTDYLNQSEFSFGKLLSAFTGPEGIRYYDKLIRAVNPDLNWTTALLPTRRLGSGLTADCRSSVVITASDSEKQLAAWLFIKWLTSVDVQVRLAGITGSFPANFRAAEKIIESPSAAASLPVQWVSALEKFHKAYKELLPNFSDYPEVSLKFEGLIEGSQNGDLIWIETWKLNREVKKQRRDERKKRRE
ncbi:MAG: extracellular solute-binding protein [Spirochaetales bacterium]|nr:extracellular solute-binding protein [Spirochaetales bacterium]